ncbi:hypothetical protein J8V57_15155 [Xenorhabdus sp. PB61.4]|uniref:hypothetical protein n=2 Tax=Xenorhabdus sp. PB61.4 TaxID=2788940 RepID=UPI001E64F439|nr:hypothetical protein [Xenorhabdus sp. PB61.4]MCC8367589.1 hypothetical protein [Xenorhabdus sp. PB61.4]
MSIALIIMTKYRTEIIGADVNVMKHNENGIFEHVCLIPLVDIPIRANAGEWDNKKVLGMRLIVEYLHNQKIDKEKNLLALRWIVATLYIMETTAKNEMPYYRNHGVMLELVMDSERLAMANNIEGAILEKFGKVQGTENAILMYNDMLDENGLLKLSPMGIEVMDNMHEAFTLEVANGALDKAEPTRH